MAQNSLAKIKDFNALIKKLEKAIDNSVSDDENQKLKGLYHPFDSYKDISQFKNIINKYNYSVDAIDNIDNKDARSGGKYLIEIKNKEGIYYNFNLLSFKEKMEDPEFDSFNYISEIIKRIEGDSKDKEELIDAIVDYLSIVISDKELFVRQYKILGFERVGSEWLFKYDKLYSGELNPQNGRLIDSDASLLTFDGDFDKSKEAQWLYCVAQVMNQHIIDSILFGAAISGLIRQILPFRKDTNLNLNICGSPGTGKSTIEHLILSIFGNPQFLEGNFTDTDNAVEQIRASRPIIPYVVDDMMLKYLGESKDKRAVDLLYDIFRESEGRVKERLGYLGEQSGERTYSAIISSSVESVLDAIGEIKEQTGNIDMGQFRRFIEIIVDDQNIIASDKHEAEFIENTAQQCFGYGILIIANYLLDILNDKHKGVDYLENRFNELNDKISNSLNNEIKSSSQRFALISLSYQIFRECIDNKINYYNSEFTEEEGFNFINNEYINKIINLSSNNEILKDKTDDIIDYLINNLRSKMNKAISTERHTNDLKNWILKAENLKYFNQCSNIFDCNTSNKNIEVEKSKLLGNIQITSEEIRIAYASKYALESMLFSSNLGEKRIEDFISIFNQVRNVSTTERLDSYREYDSKAVKFYGSMARKSKNHDEIRNNPKTGVDKYLINNDDIIFEYNKQNGIYFISESSTENQDMSLITIKR